MIRQAASTTRLVRNLPEIKEQLDKGPVEITNHGRTEFVVLSKEKYEHYRSLDGSDAERLDAKLQLVLGSITTMVFVTDTDLRVRRANRALCDYLLRRPDELVGRTLLEISDSASFRFVASRARQVVETGQEDSFELASSFRDQRLISFTIRSWPHGVIIFADDVTEKARNSERHIRNNAYDTAFEAMGDFAVGSINASGEIVYVPRSLAKMTGIPADKLLGGNFFAMLHPDDRARVSDFTYANRSGVLRIAPRILLNGADYAPAVMTLTPYPDVRGNFNFAFALRLESTQ